MAAAPKLTLVEVQEKLDEEKVGSFAALLRLATDLYPTPLVAWNATMITATAMRHWPSLVVDPLTSGGVIDLLAPMQTTSRDDDFQAWLADQANALHDRRYFSLDWDALAEELEDMAARDKRESRTRLRNLLFHLLKWKYQSGRRTASWRRTVNAERDQIEDLLKFSPSLINELRLSFDEMYERARRDAVDLLKEAAKAVPDASPWTLETVRDPQFWPDPDPELTS